MNIIPFVDLAAHHAPMRAELDAAIGRVLDHAAFILGEEVARFEAAFAEFVGVPHAVGVGSDLDAIALALRALGIGGGDEVIVPANAPIATALAVTASGAAPVLADCQLDTALIDPAAVLARLTRRTTGVHPRAPLRPPRRPSRDRDARGTPRARHR